MRSRVLAAASGLLLVVPAAQAADSWAVHFFASQTISYSTEHHFLGDTEENASFGYREVGAGISGRFAPGFRAALQMLSRQAGGNDDGTPRLDYAYLAYTPVASMDQIFSIRAGRAPYAFGLHNEVRDVAFTRPGIYMPQSMYFDRIRNSRFALDGIDLDWTLFRGYNAFVLRGQFGTLPIDDDEIDDFASVVGVTSLDPRYLYALRAEYLIDEGRIRFVGGRAIADLDIKSHSGAFPWQGGVETTIDYIGVEYNLQYWSFTAEMNWTEVVLAGTVTDLNAELDLHLRGLAYYGQATYRFSPHWSVFGRYDEGYINRNDRDGDLFAGFGLPRGLAFSKDMTLGAAWDIHSRFQVRAEWHYVDGLGFLSSRDNPRLHTPTSDGADHSDVARRWHLVALQFAYRF